MDAIADGGGKAFIQRAAVLEVEIEQSTQAIERFQKQLAIEESKPSSADDHALVESLRAELTAENDDVRVYARGRVNVTLRRLLKRIVLHPNDTFSIWPDEHTWWLFDEDGTLLEGQAIQFVA